MDSDDMASRLADARTLVGMLRERGDTVEVARSVTFELWLPTRPPAPAALTEARLAGFTVLDDDPSWGRNWLTRHLPVKGARVQLEQVTPVDERSAEAFTRTLTLLAGRYGGRFELWLPEAVGQD